MSEDKYDSNGRRIGESYDQQLIESLKDPEYAVEYLNATLEDEDYRVFLLALRDVAEASGIKKLAIVSDLNRENIYRMLSPKGNPTISSLVSLLRAIGIRLNTQPLKPLRKRRPATKSATQLQEAK
jgi:probable addiction module antidote protein